MKKPFIAPQGELFKSTMADAFADAMQQLIDYKKEREEMKRKSSIYTEGAA